MLSTNLRVTGFDAVSWGRFISLFESRRRRAHDDHRNSYGMVVVIEDPSGRACAAFIGDRGPIAADQYKSREDLPALCAEHRVRRGVALKLGTIEELTERATAQMLRTDDYAGQWLALLSAARELEREGALYFWPEPRNVVPLPTPQLVTRALDVVLPDEHSFVAALWEDAELWTALVLRRRGGQFDLIGGPELVLDTVGPLSGDFRRDHRAVSRAISTSIAPLQLGIYTQRKRFERLLREAEPGAWAKAVALRELIIDPSPAYVHFAVGADALRATARRTGELLGGIDFISFLEPWTRYAREQISHVTSITGVLGFNPLQVLARRLRANEDSTGESLVPPADGAGQSLAPAARPVSLDNTDDAKGNEPIQTATEDDARSHVAPADPAGGPSQTTEAPAGAGAETTERVESSQTTAAAYPPPIQHDSEPSQASSASATANLRDQADRNGHSHSERDAGGDSETDVARREHLASDQRR